MQTEDTVPGARMRTLTFSLLSKPTLMIMCVKIWLEKGKKLSSGLRVQKTTYVLHTLVLFFVG